MATTDTDGATCRSRRALTQTAEVGLVRPSPRGDLPHRLHRRVTDGVDAVVEVDRRIAVRRKELDALAETRRARGVGDREPAVLVAGEGIRDPRALDGLGREWLVGGERLEAGVHPRAVARRHAD